MAHVVEACNVLVLRKELSRTLLLQLVALARFYHSGCAVGGSGEGVGRHVDLWWW